MKKTLKTVAIAAATMITTGAMASVTKNMENPLYTPKSGEFYSKTTAGMMYKKADHTKALRDKGHAGDPEFPVWRFFEDFGVGITDRTSTYLSLGWTQNDDIGRSGAHRARLGVNYRVVETPENFVWDMYGEAYLAGLSKMKGSYGTTGFTYDNFSSGRWGALVGTKIGKKWSRLTTSLNAEYLQIFGNHNNEIEITHPGLLMLGFPDKISVDLKSNNEWLVSLNTLYQLSDRWSIGGSLKFIEHADNGVKSIHTRLIPVDNTTPIPQLGGATLQQAQDATVQKLLAETKSMNDGWEEYYITVSLANQVTDYLQLALYGEYVFDTSHQGSQNGTDVKMELGVRANVRF